MAIAAAANQPPRPTHQSSGPLSPEHQQSLLDANHRAQKILQAAKVATFNGWTTGFFAALSLIGGLFSITSLCLGVGLSVVARNEFRGRNLLRRFDPRGPRLLGWNQVGFIGLLIAYSLWSIYTSLTGANPYDEYIAQNPELASMLGSFSHLNDTITLAVYGGVIVLSVIFQGLNAIYYFKRGKLLREYLSLTPAWIVDLQRRSLL
jgi:hypothetical protein